MSTPMQAKDNRRSSTSVRFDPDVYDALRDAAKDRGHSINFMVNLAVTELLKRLIPASEVKLTRD